MAAVFEDRFGLPLEEALGDSPEDDRGHGGD
jgi:hypothetical protein